MFMQYVLLLTFLLSSVLSLPLASRDVVDPPITSPTADTVWYVGQTQTVTWNTTGLPVNQTNPVGMLVLGFRYNSSENLMLDSPLATNLNYSIGQAQITVPNVATGSDYIVVLFGDSGNASPEFTIISNASSPVSVPISSISPSSLPAGPTPSHTSDNSSSLTPTKTPGSSTATSPPSGITSHSSTVTTVTTSSTLPTSQSSAASQKHVPGLGTFLGVALTAIYLAFS